MKFLIIFLVCVSALSAEIKYEFLSTSVQGVSHLLPRDFLEESKIDRVLIVGTYFNLSGIGPQSYVDDFRQRLITGGRLVPHSEAERNYVNYSNTENPLGIYILKKNGDFLLLDRLDSTYIFRTRNYAGILLAAGDTRFLSTLPLPLVEESKTKSVQVGANGLIIPVIPPLIPATLPRARNSVDPGAEDAPFDGRIELGNLSLLRSWKRVE